MVPTVTVFVIMSMTVTATEGGGLCSNRKLILSKSLNRLGWLTEFNSSEMLLDGLKDMHLSSNVPSQASMFSV